MANTPRSRKRVRPPRRAADGSAFTTCDECGISVAVALMDMHECNLKQNVKKSKPSTEENHFNPSITQNNNVSEQPRSPFIFFMEEYSKSFEGRPLIEINREAFELWTEMTPKEQWPYVLKARKVETAYLNVLNKEERQLSQVGDDEADSSKYMAYNRYEVSEDDCSEDEDPLNQWNCIRCPIHQSCFCVEAQYGQYP